MEVLASEVKQAFDHLSKKEWEDLWRRLRYFTYTHYWVSLRINRGVDLNDLIQESIVDAVTGKRRWPPDVKLVTFLCHVIRSKASHMLEKGNNKTKSIEEISDPVLTAYYNPPNFNSSEDLHEKADYNELCNKIRTLVREDKLLKKIVDLWILDNRLKPREMAYMLNISIEEMRAAQKRLSRRLRGLRRE